MSTKAIRATLERFVEAYGDYAEECEAAGRRKEAADVRGDVSEARAALAELEAIERGAKEWADVDGQPGPGRMQRLDMLLRSIAKDAP